MELCRGDDAHAFYGLPHLGSSARCLKTLHLVKISLEKSFTQQMQSGCPVLEVLKFDSCCLNFPEITSGTLKNLIVTDCTAYCGNVLTIMAPALTSFYLVITIIGFNWYGILVNEMPSLVKASVCLESWGRTTSSLPKRPCKILGSLVNVRDLQLSGSKTLSMLHHGSDTFRTFPNLRTLLFDGCDLSDNFQILGSFLKNAANLETLSLQHCKLPKDSRKRKTMENPKSVSFKCLDTLTFKCPKLKPTEIKYKADDVHQLFGLLSGIWRNLRKTSIVLTKA